jgi:PIN domain nuclease of toxin-antitoxin system
MNLFDASALLWFLRGEEGADVVEREPTEGGTPQR